MRAFSSWVSSIFSLPASDSDASPTVHDLAAARRKAGDAAPGFDDVVLGGRYELRMLLGRGASATVYQARDRVLELDVAIKLIHIDRTQEDADQRAQMLRHETRAAMGLSHPNILRVFHYERSGDWDFVVMELLRGESLHQLAGRRTTRHLGVKEVLRYGHGVLQALTYAHELGVVHNDLKPSNLMRARRGVLKVCDFGLASVGGVHAVEGVAGTPAFMAPERIQGEPGDARSDLYSLAATLFALGLDHRSAQKVHAAALIAAL